jgi:Conserved in the green lineage and diatoms 27
MPQKLSCPVPKDQRPINEYMKLVQSDFFNWPILTESLFIKKIINLFFLFFTIALPFSNLFINFNKSIIKLLLVNSAVSSFLVIFIILRLLLGWNYIKQRLNNSKVFYEESSWYDGRIWTKSRSILFQEKLIHMYQVLPIIKKINNILIGTCTFLITFLLLLIF